VVSWASVQTPRRLRWLIVRMFGICASAGRRSNSHSNAICWKVPFSQLYDESRVVASASGWVQRKRRDDLGRPSSIFGDELRRIFSGEDHPK
jgi:hypothetical protein